MLKDVYGEALTDFHKLQEIQAPLLLHSSYGDIEEMPIDIFFRDEDDFPELEIIALALCDGKTLDVGAGVGAHARYLQDKGFTVDALEISEKACAIMKERGVHNVVAKDFFALKDVQYDTLLFLMNGIGLAGTLAGFRDLLRFSKTLMTERGQLLFDSSNIAYLYEEFKIPLPESYLGEIQYQYEYKGEKGEPFQWVYLDQDALIKIANEENWVVQVLYEDENDQYLVRMEPRKLDLTEALEGE